MIEVRNFDQRRDRLAFSMMKSPNQNEACKHEYKTIKVENIQANDDDVLQHEFQGCSVWLEFDKNEQQRLSECIDELALCYGGAAKGVHSFTPHCTLLYNIPVSSIMRL